MNILVTGAAGFIGSHLSDKLLSLGHQVHGVDNLLSGSKENIAHLMKNPAFSFVEHDIIDPYYPKGRVDVVMNLACPASPKQYQANAIRTVKANTLGVINMLGLARAHQARFFQASTSEIYGDPLTHPQVESYRGNVSTTGPRACYDEGKRVAETLCFDYHRTHGLNIRIARIFNTYGPRMFVDDGRVVSNFIVQALTKDRITIYGDGSQTRSFCYVSDLVDGIIKLTLHPTFSGPVNLGNPSEITVRDFASEILEAVGRDIPMLHEPLPMDDPLKRRPDISLAKEMLGWSPLVSRREGVQKTIEYFREKLGKN